MKAQLRVEGSIVAEGGVFTLGQELAGKGGFTTDDLTNWDLTNDETLVAGQASAISLSAQGISAAQLANIKRRLTQTQSQLQANNITGLTSDHIVGAILATAVWGYFTALQGHGELKNKGPA